MALICVSRREEFTKNGSKTTGQVSFYSSRQDTDNGPPSSLVGTLKDLESTPRAFTSPIEPQS
jgi:hypothetical protein